MSSPQTHRTDSNRPDKTVGMTKVHYQVTSEKPLVKTPHQRLMQELFIDRITGFGDDGPKINGEPAIDKKRIVSFLEENGFVLSPLFKNTESPNPSKS